MTRAELAATIDQALLRPNATRADVEHVCDEARNIGFAAVCVLSAWAGVAAQRLAGSRVAPASVVGFPYGVTPTAAKVAEARAAIAAGARELDMVMQIGAAKSGDWRTVEDDIAAVVAAGHESGALVKVIIECAYLTDEEKHIAAKIVAREGADFVKTGTGLVPGGEARIADVRLLAATVAGTCGVKAAGGIRTAEDALAMLAAGATRIGTSSGAVVVGSLPEDGV